MISASPVARLPRTLALAGAVCLAAGLCPGPGWTQPLQRPTSPGQGVDLRQVPEPALDGALVSVRRSIRQAQARVQQPAARSTDAESREALAEAYGELAKLYLHYGFEQAAEPAFDNAARLATGEDSVQWAYYRAVAQEGQGDLKGAAQSLRRVLDHREGNLPAVLRLANILLQLDRPGEAAYLFEAATQSELGIAAARAGLGQIALDAGRAQDAVDHFEAALEAQPAATALRYRLGIAYRDLGNDEKARDLLSQSGGVEPQIPDPLMAQLRLQMEGAGNRQVAAGLAARQGQMKTAIEGYRKALREQPENLQARRSLAAALVETGDLEGAGREYREMLRRDPQNASARMELGTVEAALARDPKAAIEHFQQAVELAPEFREARSRLARALAASGRLPESVPHLEKAVELDPRHARSRLQLARALLETRRVDDAAQQVAQLLAQEPDHLDAIILNGRIQGVKGNAEAAEGEFMRLAELSSASHDQRARAYFNLGLLRQAQSRPAGAAEMYAKAIQLDPRHPQALFNLALLMTSVGKLDQAAGLYRRLLDVDPSQQDVRYRLAVTLMNQGEHAEALEHFEGLFRSHPKNIDVLTAGSLLLAELGRGDEAADRLLRAMGQIQETVPKARLKSTLGAVEIKNGRRERGLGHLRDAAEKAPKHPEVLKRYADALAGEKRYREAAEPYAAYLELVPEDSRTAFAYATSLILGDQWRRAVDALGELTASSADVALSHLLARLLASAPDPQVRDGARAVQVAQAVFSAERNPAHGETLAMAMAAAGRFDEALALQERLLKEAEDARFDPGFIDRVRRNLDHYRQGQLGVSDW